MNFFGTQIGLAALTLCAACDPYSSIIGESNSTDPAGSIAVQVNAEPALTAPGVADFNMTSLTIVAQSPTLVVGLTAGDDAFGNDAKTVLANASASVVLTLTSTSRTALQMHLEQKSCVATSGTITLSTNTASQISGSWDVTGTFADGSACTATGTITTIPEQH